MDRWRQRLVRARTLRHLRRPALAQDLGDFKYLDDNGTAWVPEDDKVVTRQNNRVHDLDGAVRGFVALPGARELSLLALGFDREQGIPGLPRTRGWSSR